MPPPPTFESFGFKDKVAVVLLQTAGVTVGLSGGQKTPLMALASQAATAARLVTAAP